MSTQEHIFDAVGPRGRRTIRIVTALSVLAILAVAFLVVQRFGQAGQLAADRWAEFTQWPYIQFLLAGLGNTALAAAASALFAIPTALVMALGRTSRRPWLRWPATAYIEFFRSVPLLLVVYVFVSGLPSYGINPDIFWKLVIPITLCSSAVMAEIFRAGILALPAGQTEAALSLGMQQSQATRFVVLPQAVRIVVPSMVAQLVVLLKDTTLGYAVSYPELMKTANNLTAYTNHLIQTFLVIAAVYVVTNILISHFARYLERRVSGRTARAGKPAGLPEQEPAPAGIG
ncbi:polar amino acid ABC transporter permease [Sinomonas atrocyanea]|uniref:Polar amino acid ABC transporter permease n=1 Tax=Sinomonas atrocyanea TaxID=37927 RepID=A0A127A479_9MICC|nr:amino acid ABC transporter permease [Sinomonas atrocyanea]AMM34229.1 polar amino acid ABC transporter permease [Sinomonas atrocyanea]GEB64742.1 amino acid ABC transporter permease [Sinomonas atrocyanea]GGG66640.1 amino acid ABC transporter permease [Sinomonas atrocyanea]